jgi:hypothetical protein
MPIIYLNYVPPPHRNWYAPKFEYHAATITYKNRETGEEITVPNRWCNQPVEFRRATAIRAIAQTEDMIHAWKRAKCRAPDGTMEWKEARMSISTFQMRLHSQQKWLEKLKELPDWVIGESIHSDEYVTPETL